MLINSDGKLSSKSKEITSTYSNSILLSDIIRCYSALIQKLIPTANKKQIKLIKDHAIKLSALFDKLD